MWKNTLILTSFSLNRVYYSINLLDIVQEEIIIKIIFINLILKSNNNNNSKVYNIFLTYNCLLI